MDLSVTFHGAVARTTGSAHIVKARNKQYLLDCGMIQGIPHHHNRKLSFEPQDIDAVILSHAHIDHSGRIPLLFKQGYDGPVYCTAATKDLAKILLLDAVNISKEEFKRERKAGKKVSLEPLYSKEDVYNALKRFTPISYRKTKGISKNVSLEFLDAGHILGSAQPILDFDGTTVAFTGDLGQNDQPLIKNPDPMKNVHYLITESTYGDRVHPPMGKASQMLVDYAKYITKKGGKLLVPSFSVGRTQTLIYFLNEIFENGEIDRTPVYVDSPMAINATNIYLKHPECFDKETLKLLKSGDNPLKFPELSFAKSHKDHQAILRGWETCVVFAGSGMCTGGRILNHLINDLPTKKSVLLFVGYQARGTLGRKILDGAKKVRIYNREIPVKILVKSIQGFSAHADRKELKEHINRMEKKPSKTFVVHGEARQSLTFAANLRNTLGIWARVPEYKQKYRLRQMG
ncbi:MAG: MBL fold metallo-hydrolase RNA specificity domain-containing protein [Candidatus Heimdallarchaeota archaeon]